MQQAVFAMALLWQASSRRALQQQVASLAVGLGLSISASNAHGPCPWSQSVAIACAGSRLPWSSPWQRRLPKSKNSHCTLGGPDQWDWARWPNTTARRVGQSRLVKADGLQKWWKAPGLAAPLAVAASLGQPSLLRRQPAGQPSGALELASWPAAQGFRENFREISCERS